MKLNQAYLKLENYAGLLDDLGVIKTTFPDFWQKIIKNSVIVENIAQFFNFFGDQTQDLNVKDQLSRLDLTYILFFSQTQEFILSRIVNETNYNISISSQNLFLKSVRYKPEITKEIINIFLEKSKNQSRTLFNLLSERNAEEFNLLMLAACYQPSTLEYLLFILNQQIHHHEKAEISALFLSQNNQAWNPLSLAVKHQPKAILLIFDFIQVNSDYFDLERLNIIFNQKINTESCFLTILLRYESEVAINRCLDFVSSRFRDTQNKEWLALILNKTQTGNLLRVATQSTQGAFKALLNFISQHSKQLESETLQQFFL